MGTQERGRRVKRERICKGNEGKKMRRESEL